MYTAPRMPAHSSAAALRAVLARPGLHVMPCCFDAHSARLIERAGFALTFMSGFAVSASRIGLPDTGLISYGEMLDQGRNICGAVGIPVIGDGDTGYGNAINVKRTVAGYAGAGFACVMIEDQRAPKRCGHTRGKEVVDRARGAHADPRRRRRARGGRADPRDGAHRRARHRTASTRRSGARARSRTRAPTCCSSRRRATSARWSACARRRRCRRWRTSSRAATRRCLRPAALEALGYRIAAYPLTLLSAATARDAARARRAAPRRARRRACFRSTSCARWSASTRTTPSGCAMRRSPAPTRRSR